METECVTQKITSWETAIKSFEENNVALNYNATIFVEFHEIRSVFWQVAAALGDNFTASRLILKYAFHAHRTFVVYMILFLLHALQVQLYTRMITQEKLTVPNDIRQLVINKIVLPLCSPVEIIDTQASIFELLLAILRDPICHRDSAIIAEAASLVHYMLQRSECINSHIDQSLWLIETDFLGLPQIFCSAQIHKNTKTVYLRILLLLMSTDSRASDLCSSKSIHGSSIFEMIGMAMAKSLQQLDYSHDFLEYLVEFCRLLTFANVQKLRCFHILMQQVECDLAFYIFAATVKSRDDLIVRLADSIRRFDAINEYPQLMLVIRYCFDQCGPISAA